MNPFARMGFGCVAGIAATFLMDEVTEIVYTEDIARREREVQEKSSSQVLAQKILDGFYLNPTDKDVAKVASLLHWGLGMGSGALAGLFAKSTGVRASFAVAAGMFVFDEFGLSLLGAAPLSTRYPWQTNMRSVLGHAAYGLSLAMAYEALSSLSKQANADQNQNTDRTGAGE